MGADDLLCDLSLEREGAVVVDAVMLNDVALALEGRAPLRRTLTVAGHVRAPAVVRAPLGTSMADLVRACGGPLTSPLGWVPYHNGALGGHQVGWDAAVDLDTRGVVVLPHDHPLVVRDATPRIDHLRRALAACASCAICTEICPSRLNGAGIAPQRLMLFREEAALSALECVGCRTCTQLCPAGLDPSAVIGQIAADLRRRGVELADGHRLAPHPDRPGRRVAVRRMSERLGLDAYDAPLHRDPRAGRSVIPDRLALPLRGPSGAERVPVVSGGQTVHMGDVVALAAAGSREVDLRSPVEGTVHGVDPDDGVLILPL
jgi:Na+-translocating ferredoxin:NAD+ oxidoreductase RnfC subunit